MLIILNPVHHFNLSSFVPLLVQDDVRVVDSFGNCFLVMACAGREGLLDGHPGQEEVTFLSMRPATATPSSHCTLTDTVEKLQFFCSDTAPQGRIWVI